MNGLALPGDLSWFQQNIISTISSLNWNWVAVRKATHDWCFSRSILIRRLPFRQRIMLGGISDVGRRCSKVTRTIIFSASNILVVVKVCFITSSEHMTMDKYRIIAIYSVSNKRQAKQDLLARERQPEKRYTTHLFLLGLPLLEGCFVTIELDFLASGLLLLLRFVIFSVEFSPDDTWLWSSLLRPELVRFLKDAK